jgi:hypothetical protein
MNFEIAPKSTEVQTNWEEARMYCFSLNIDGKIGWRLPTKEELNDIYESENDFEEWYYWSSTESNGSKAWFQNFNVGHQSSHGVKNNGNIYIRAVRDLL